MPWNKDTPLALLSLDGGGFRGLSSLIILERLMLEFNAIYPPPPGQQWMPYQVFDLIIGTSTGGLIALLLGRAGMSATEAKDTYLKVGPDIFTTDQTEYDWFLSGVPMFDSGRYEKIVEKIIFDKLKIANAPLIPSENLFCRTTVTTTLKDQNGNRALLLRAHSDSTDNQGNLVAGNWTITKAALATSAAPTFFSPLDFNNRQYTDAGAACDNNPTLLAIAEAGYIPSFSGNKIGCILSVGTGDNPGFDLPSAPPNHLLPVPTGSLQSYDEAVLSETEPVASLASVFHEVDSWNVQAQEAKNGWLQHVKDLIKYILGYATGSARVDFTMRMGEYRNVYHRMSTPGLTLKMYDASPAAIETITTMTELYLQSPTGVAAIQKAAQVLKTRLQQVNSAGRLPNYETFGGKIKFV
ncbi:acyl transferase/acyl hydrolase/lysophospholipase [Auriculariales sp. MPI-PUGE-AT-0066]|nr:acyl transferase/acyl hydrolase/lysophospholipase [Auriculariales sp. MPI-PUGE-AT-0066]